VFDLINIQNSFKIGNGIANGIGRCWNRIESGSEATGIELNPDRRQLESN